MIVNNVIKHGISTSTTIEAKITLRQNAVC